MVGVVLDACQPLDDGGHAPGGPKRRAKIVGFRPLLERAFQLAEVLAVEAWPAASTASPFERSGALVLPDTVPAADGLPVDSELAGDLGLVQTPLKEFGGLDPPLFQLCKLFDIAFYAFRITHAQSLPEGGKYVTILCSDQ